MNEDINSEVELCFPHPEITFYAAPEELPMKAPSFGLPMQYSFKMPSTWRLFLRVPDALVDPLRQVRYVRVLLADPQVETGYWVFVNCSVESFALSADEEGLVQVDLHSQHRHEMSLAESRQRKLNLLTD